MDCKEDSVEKLTSLGRMILEFLSQSIYLSTNPRMYIKKAHPVLTSIFLILVKLVPEIAQLAFDFAGKQLTIQN